MDAISKGLEAAHRDTNEGRGVEVEHAAREVFGATCSPALRR